MHVTKKHFYVLMRVVNRKTIINYKTQKISNLNKTKGTTKNCSYEQPYIVLTGREDRIRTCDPLVPNQMLYQAEPLPDNGGE